MIKEIECVGENLEDFIRYGDQIPAYRDFQGGPDPNVSKKVQAYYILGKKFAEVFDEGEDFLESLKRHTESCEKCSKTMAELKEKYRVIKKEELEKLSEQTKDNLRYFGLL